MGYVFSISILAGIIVLIVRAVRGGPQPRWVYVGTLAALLAALVGLYVLVSGLKYG